MGAHVFIVNKDTFAITRFRCVAAVVREMKEGGQYVEKTRTDILADISCVRKGDRIFFYEINNGFHGIYEAEGTAFVDKDEIKGKNDEYLFGSEENAHYTESSLILPNRVLIKPKLYLEKPINEWRNASQSAFGRFTSAIDLRSIFYKKVLGRGKSITHLFPEEENKLTELLLKYNKGKGKELTYEPYKPKNPEPIIFDLEPTPTGEVKYEKILEGWLIQNIDNPSAGTEQFLGDLEEIECFANYVPVSIAGGNLDILVFHKRKDSNLRHKITIIELKKGKVAEDDIVQMESYVKWAFENLTKTLVEKPTKVEISLSTKEEIIQPVLIGKEISGPAIEKCKQYTLNQRKPILISYDLDHKNYKVLFNHITY